MDEIGQDPKLNVGFPRGRWLDVAVAVALIAAAVLAAMTGRGSGPAAAPAARPGAAAAPALLPSTVRARIPVPSGQPGGMTVLGSTAWISDWSASRMAGVDLAAGRVTKTLQVGSWQDEPVSMTSGAGRSGSWTSPARCCASTRPPAPSQSASRSAGWAPMSPTGTASSG
jgi:hypothetical protein